MVIAIGMSNLLKANNFFLQVMKVLREVYGQKDYRPGLKAIAIV